MPKSRNNPVILCVDDDPAVLAAVRSLLEKTMGGQADIEVAECGDDALDICEDLADEGRPVSIVISDYIMPNMRGDDLLIKLHERAPKMIKIMLTGQSDLTGVKRVINKASLYRFLEKPFNNADLVLTAKAAVDSHRAEQEMLFKIDELQQVNKSLKMELASIQAQLGQTGGRAG
jgi:response regulator RpfG family c-di-GMP phosphodiesterase